MSGTNNSNHLVSVVIPCLNEEKTLGICIEKIKRVFTEDNINGEILVCDNGSTDKSVEIAEDMNVRVVHQPVRGYGSAYLKGFESAIGSYIIMGDADDSYNFEEIAPFINKLKEGYELVMGNRFRGTIENGAMPFLHRYLGTPVLTLIMNLFFKTGIGDVNCGMRGLTKEAFQKMELKANGMEFATEMIVKASLMKLKISEVPCNLYKDKRSRKPNLKTWHDGWRHLRFMLLFTPTWTFLVPGLLFFLVGLIGMLLLTLRDIVVPEMFIVISQKHMLSFMMLLLLGFQITGLGLGAKIFSFSKKFDCNSKSINLLEKYFTLEKGMLSACVLIILSVFIFSYLLISFYWRVLPFLNDIIRLDLAIYGISFAILGVQIIYLSFFISLFYLKVK